MKINLDLSELESLIKTEQTVSDMIDDTMIVEDIQLFAQKNYTDVGKVIDESGTPAFQVVTQPKGSGIERHVLNIQYNERFEYGDKANEKDGLKETPLIALGKNNRFFTDLDKYLKIEKKPS